MKLKGCVVALLFLQTWLKPVFAAACHSESGQYVIPLLELYTSEGCSSCPPADRWLSSLRSRQGEVNALAFHVDYWDGLGWKDRFAQEAFSDKQRTQASQTGSNVVYTPQFTLNGYDFRGWSGSRLDRLLQKINLQPAQVTLALQQLNEDNGQIAFRTTVTTPQQHLPVQLWLAIYQHGLHTQVKAGENNGRVLNHDFVVLQHMGPYSLDQLNTLRHLVPDQSLLAHANGVVLYARHALNGEVLQSLQLPLCRPGH